MKNFNDVIIGGTGFLGEKIAKCIKNPFIVNTKTKIKDLKKIEKTNILYLCAPTSLRFKSIENPEEDLNQILDILKKILIISPKKIIFFSTVDAFGKFKMNTDKSYNNYFSENNFYGFNRWYLEKFLLYKYKDVSIIRLTNMYGENLRKNVIFDILKSNKKITLSDDIQQWVNADLIAKLIVKLKNRLPKFMIINSEPIRVSEIKVNVFSKKNINFIKSKRNYDLKSYYRIKDRKLIRVSKPGYHFSKKFILDDMVKLYS